MTLASRVRSRSRFSQETWTPDKVILDMCGPPDGTYINKDGGGVLSCWQEWKNNNTVGDPDKAYIRAQPTFNGETVPINVNEEHQYRRQVDETTYELMCAANGSNHAVPFAVDMADLPEGENITYGVKVLELVPRHLIGF